MLYIIIIISLICIIISSFIIYSINNNTIKLYIKHDDKLIKIKISKNKQIIKLMYILQEKENINLNQQVLIFNNIRLNEHFLLTDYKLKNNDIIENAYNQFINIKIHYNDSSTYYNKQINMNSLKTYQIMIYIIIMV